MDSSDIPRHFDMCVFSERLLNLLKCVSVWDPEVRHDLVREASASNLSL